MKFPFSLLACALLVAGCMPLPADRPTVPLHVLREPVPDYCAAAVTTGHLVANPGTSLMGGSPKYRREMAERLAAQEALCSRQKAGSFPAAGSPWPAHLKRI